MHCPPNGSAEDLVTLINSDEITTPTLPDVAFRSATTNSPATIVLVGKL